MPIRIAIAGAIAIAACMVVPVSVSAVSDGPSAVAEDAEPPEPDPSIAPAAAIASDGLAGASVHAAGYTTELSWPILLMLIAAGFVPAALMIARSATRRRAGPLPYEP